MKTDRELLELAAKAAGIAIEPCTCGSVRWPFRLSQGHKPHWNPLTDSGQAFELAVQLGLFNSPRVAHEIAVELFTRNADKLTAHRRAYVITAAAIGESMK